MPAWIPVVVVVGAIAAYIAYRVFGKPAVDRQRLVDEAKTEAQSIKDDGAKKLAADLRDANADEAELAEISKVGDDAERLSALADYANRKGE